MTQANPHGSILLADDHGLVRHGLQLLIADVLPQLRVHLTGSLAETVQVLATAGRFDLVLLDLTLSDVHGMAGLRRLREEFPYVPVVILSAQDDRDTVLAALDAGAMGFISKAASPAELREALTRVLVEHRIHLPQSVSGGMAAASPEGGGRELYDLKLDPYEVSNRVHWRGYRKVVRKLARQLKWRRFCSGAKCRRGTGRLPLPKLRRH